MAGDAVVEVHGIVHVAGRTGALARNLAGDTEEPARCRRDPALRTLHHLGERPTLLVGVVVQRLAPPFAVARRDG
jgi:hypothetical protein